MSHALALTRRDARRDADGPDYTKLLLVLAAFGAGLAVWWKYGRTAQAAPSAPGGTQPGPGPGNIPASPSPQNLPPAPKGGPAEIAQGDLVTVDPAVAVSLVPGLPAPPTAPVQFLVIGAGPGSPVIVGQTTGVPAGVPPGITVPIPRAGVTSVAKGGGGQLPTPVAPPSAPAGANLVVTDLGSPITVKQGHHYRARVQLSTLERMLGNVSAVASQFTAAGFTDVHAFKGNVDPLPADWPLMTIAAPPIDDGTYFVEGTWPSPDSTVPRPPQVVVCWEQ